MKDGGAPCVNDLCIISAPRRRRKEGEEKTVNKRVCALADSRFPQAAGSITCLGLPARLGAYLGDYPLGKVETNGRALKSLNGQERAVTQAMGKEAFTSLPTCSHPTQCAPSPFERTFRMLTNEWMMTEHGGVAA